ncbi:hypothetical protein KUTeg_000320 [Tegillarca granosa]|uniref:Uncharacterized protein n=1 Tax=Tegillarca granosa TaxID=220873 RepID=A0ABQ9FX77_TEGGR|nr:hypothetical protein KUTeg_000320 [Tegillarca granosa]
MATSVDESLLEEFDVYESQIIRLQALIRGRLVRKWIKQIKQDYVEVFREIEQSDRNTVIWPYYSLCYPLIQKTRKQVTSDFRSNPTSRRSSTSSPRDGSTVNMSYEKENQVKFCKNDETVAKQKDVNRIIAGCRNCFPRSELSERPGFNSKLQDQTSQKTKQTEHEKHSESSCRCSDVEKVQDLEIQNVFPVSAEKMKPPLIKNVEVKSRSEIYLQN